MPPNQAKGRRNTRREDVMVELMEETRQKFAALDYAPEDQSNAVAVDTIGNADHGNQNNGSGVKHDRKATVRATWSMTERIVDQFMARVLQSETQRNDENDGGGGAEMQAEDDTPISLGTFQTLVEIVICWGVAPRLLPGIGLAAKNRLAFSTEGNQSKRMQWKMRALSAMDKRLSSARVRLRSECYRLFKCLKMLFGLMFEWANTFARNIIQHHYFADVVAACFQLAYDPSLINTADRKKPEHADKSQRNYTLVQVKELDDRASPASLIRVMDTMTVENEGKVESTSLSSSYGCTKNEKVTGLREADRRQCIHMLNVMLRKSQESIVVRNLLLLISQPKCPSWLKRHGNVWLSRTLMKPNGVYAVLDTSSSKYAHEESKNFERVVSLICTVPALYKDRPHIYWDSICSQICKLFHLRHNHLQHVRKAALMTAITILQDYPAIGRQHILEPIVAPLYTFMTLHRRTQKGHRVVHHDEQSRKLFKDLENRANENHSGEHVIVEEDRLVNCIENLHMLLTGNGPGYQVFHTISDIVPALFQLYCFISRTKLFVKASCEEIITSYFRFSDDTLQVIKNLVKFERRSAREQYFVTFAPGETGGACIKAVPESTRDHQWEAQCVINLLKLMKNEEVSGDLFVHLCEQFAALKEEIRVSNVLTEEDETVSSHSTLLLQTILLMIENLGESIMKNTLQVILLVKFMLLSELEEVRHGRQEEAELEESLEKMSIVLAILEAILKGDYPIRTVEEEQRIEELLPILQLLKNHPNIQVSEFANANSLLIESKSYKVAKQNAGDNKEEDKEAADKAKIQSIMEDLKSPVVPVRSYGMNCLREMVIARSPTIEKHLSHVLDIFKNQLKDEDSFAYHGAIQGLATMGDVYPDFVIPLLCVAYRDLQVQYEHRLKVGEALLDVAEKCGQVLPKYAHHFVSTFLAQCREKPNGPDDDPGALSFMKASSVSNLATVAETLKFGIHPFMQDILDCATVLSTDPDKDVRRAVIFLFLRIVKSLQRDMFDVMKDHVRHMVHELKKVEFYDNDGLIRHNATMVIDEIGDIAGDALTPDWFSDVSSQT